MQSVLAIINPRSGTQLGAQAAQRLSQIALSHQIEITIRPTTSDRSVSELVADAAAFSRVIACGGDGTVTAVINGLVGKKVPLAIVPIGTGNVLGQAIGINPDYRLACDDAMADCDFLSLDLGLLNDKTHFALRLSTGYEALVTQDTTREMKSRLGKLAYLWEAARHALRPPSARYRIDVDGEVMRQRAASVWVANTSTLGILGLELDPAISLSDRQLDLCIFKLSASRDMQRVFQWFFRRERLPATAVMRIPVRNYVNIVAASRQPVQVDGDAIGHTPCRVRVVPGALSVCIPRKA
ncbi:MAG: diacylglycerol kinase family lipid kinase [Chloroflexi bacterium]|nr:diacylglycerol kinase family lipid kinase [Chloroflexota bacterium]MCL5274347.1 diacylglycerol kinase family lipid kinase [Chloroflexota bacterium]